MFVLFLIGLEFDFSHLRRHSRAAAAISIAGVALPFLLGLGLARLLLPYVGLAADVNGRVPELGFALFLGTALSLTAIPVLGRIMLELGIQRSAFNKAFLAEHEKFINGPHGFLTEDWPMQLADRVA